MKKSHILMLCAILFMNVFSSVTYASDAEDTLYQCIDLQKVANGRVYLDNLQQAGANVTWADAEPSDSDFMIWQNNANNRYAIQTSSMESLLADGILTDKQAVPYQIGLSDVISLRKNTVSETKIELEQGYYENLYFLSCNVGEISSGVTVVAEYADNTKEQFENITLKNSYFSTDASDDESVAAVAARYNSFGKTDFRLMQYVGIFKNSIRIDDSKRLKSISFINDSDYELKILAVTAKKISTQKLTELVQDRLNHLNDEKQYLEETKSLIDDLRQRGVDVHSFAGYSDFIQMYENSVYEKIYNYVDISQNANAKIYLDSSPNPGAAVAWSDFVTSDIDGLSWKGNTANRFGIQTSSLKSLTKDGILKDTEDIGYNITFSNTISVVNSYPKVQLDLDNRVYRKINFLAVSVCDAGQTMGVEIAYTDGTKETKNVDILNSYGVSTGEKVVAAPSMYVSWNKSSFTRALTMGINKYSIDTDITKEIDSISFNNTSAVNVQVLAVTMEEGSNSQIKEAIRQSIAQMKKDGEYLHAINANLELLIERGAFIDDIEGLDKFYDAYRKCVYIENISEYTDFDVTDITVTFFNPITVNDNCMRVYKNSEELLDYEIKVAEADDREIHILFDNTMDYDAEYTLLLSENISSMSDSSYILGKDIIRKLKVTPPLDFTDVSISGTPAGIEFGLNAVNNTKNPTLNCNIFVAVYTTDGEMLSAGNYRCTVSSNEPLPVSFHLEGRDGEEKVIVECYAVDNYSTLKFLYPDIKKEI